MPNALLASRLAGQTWAALTEEGRPRELHVEVPGEAGRAERVLRGRVTNLLPGIQSAFLDVGEAREAFLYAGDLVLPGESAEAAAAPIEQRLAVGRELTVQVRRSAVRDKGPRVSCRLELAGRLLVAHAFGDHRGVSRRIDDNDERERLLRTLQRREGSCGLVARTAAAGAGETALDAEAAELESRMAALLREGERRRAPAELDPGPDLFGRLLRDTPLVALDRIVVDAAELERRALDYLGQRDPRLAGRVLRHDGPGTLVEDHGLLDAAARVLRPRVWLPSGGSIVIEQTEALVSVDVNTGRDLGPGPTALRVNLEAAVEIARQLRLRDLGGLIVVDMVDLDAESDREAVRATLVAALERDRARPKLLDAGGDLLQLTRKRRGPGLAARLGRPCAGCGGLGRVRSALLVAAEALVALRAAGPDSSGATVRVEADPEVAAELRRALDAGSAATRVRIEEHEAIGPPGYRILSS